MSEHWQQFMSMDAGVHINQFTVISHRWYRAEDRVTLTLEGTNMVRLTLYLPRGELPARPAPPTRRGRRRLPAPGQDVVVAKAGEHSGLSSRPGPLIRVTRHRLDPAAR